MVFGIIICTMLRFFMLLYLFLLHFGVSVACVVVDVFFAVFSTWLLFWFGVSKAVGQCGAEGARVAPVLLMAPECVAAGVVLKASGVEQVAHVEG